MEELDLEGFERYCKNINFVKSIANYKSYLQKGIKVLKEISNDSLKEFSDKEQQNNQYLKNEFTEEINRQNLHPDLYNDFKSALKKYMNFINKKYPLSRAEIEAKYNQIFHQIQQNGSIKLKTHNSTVFTLETNSSSLCARGTDGQGKTCNPVALVKVLRILFENENYTYSSYEPSVINYIFGKIEEDMTSNNEREDLKRIIKTFQEKWDNTDDLWRQEYITGLSKKYRDFKINISFGMGLRLQKPKTAYINFLMEPYKTSKGIYPFISYEADNQQFEVGLGVSRDNEPDVSQSIIDKIESYKSRYVYINEIDHVVNALNIAIDNFFKITQEDDSLVVVDNNLKQSSIKSPLNQILYGPPGTGKTYNTINKAIEIIETRKLTAEELTDRNGLKEKFDEYKNSGQIVFVTFHQSYGYEEFVEGVKAIPVGEEGNENGQEMIYKAVDGVFKSLAKECTSKDEVQESNLDNYENSTIWKMSLGDSQNGEDKTYFEEAVSTDTIIMGYGGDINYTYCNDKESIQKLNPNNHTSINMIHRFKNELKNNDIVIVSDGNRKFKAIVQVVGDYFYDENSDFKHKRKIKWLKKFTTSRSYSEISDRFFTQVTLNRPQGVDKNKLLSYLSRTTIIDNSTKNYILIIDEINRGNISKIFGELITLIEDGKRIGAAEELKVKLPYTNEDFGVPSNLYILGTMNTADRSIALMDTALRRRFEFVEMMPDLQTLQGIKVAGIDIYALLEVINKRVEYLYDRDHTIGHAYFMELKKDDSELSILSNIFKNKIIPLLQEYFYDDWEKIRLVLGDNQKEDKTLHFIRVKSNYSMKELFGEKGLDSLDIDDEPIMYEINEKAFNTSESYIKIYEK